MRAISRRRPATLAVTMAMLWTSSFAWLAAFSPRPLRFRRTPKSAGRTTGIGPSLDTIGGTLALVTAAVFAIEGVPLTAIALTLSAGGLVVAPTVDHWLRRAAVQQVKPCAA